MLTSSGADAYNAIVVTLQPTAKGAVRHIANTGVLSHLSRFSVHFCTHTATTTLQQQQFTDVLQDFMKDLMPNRLCDYLYALAIKFTDFVTNCHVLKSAERDSRLLLCEATGVTMRQTMQLLGLTPLHQI
jgi:hypothetical protein